MQSLYRQVQFRAGRRNESDQHNPWELTSECTSPIFTGFSPLACCPQRALGPLYKLCAGFMVSCIAVMKQDCFPPGLYLSAATSPHFICTSECWRWPLRAAVFSISRQYPVSADCCIFLLEKEHSPLTLKFFRVSDLSLTFNDIWDSVGLGEGCSFILNEGGVIEQLPRMCKVLGSIQRQRRRRNRKKKTKKKRKINNNNRTMALRNPDPASQSQDQCV